MKKRILMIEDDEELCEEKGEILIDEGYHVTTASDGLKGKRLLEKSDYDILILDVKLPCLSGLNILEIVRKQKLELKVIILTGKPLTKNFKRAESCTGEEDVLKLADEIISKPFDVKTLLAKIKELSSRTGA